MRSWVSIAVLALLGGVALVGVFSRRSPPAVPPVPSSPVSAVGTDLTRAPELRRARLQANGTRGEEVDLRQYRGQRVTLVNFWATWCPPCAKELPDFATVAAEFPNEVVILAVNRGEPRPVQADYLRSTRGGTLLRAPGLIFLDDPADRAYEDFGGYGMPVTAFVTKNGQLAFVKSGLLTLEEMRQRIRETLSLP